MPEVAWLPGLTERPVSGAWVMALTGDGVPIVRWVNDHQCCYPLKHLTRIDRPRRYGWTSMGPGPSWKPDPMDFADGAPYPWLAQRRAA